MTAPDHNAAALTRALSSLGITLPHRGLDEQLRFWTALEEEAARIDLLSPAALRQGPVRHVGDALAALAFGPLPSTLLDIGSGGGLPGIPLALASPSTSVVLLEARAKRADWLQRAVVRLGLGGRVEIVVGRLEDQDEDWVAGFPLLTARAVAPPERLLPLLLPRLRSAGRLLVWHSAAQRGAIGETLEEWAKTHHKTSIRTISYIFVDIDFSSNISEIRITEGSDHLPREPED